MKKEPLKVYVLIYHREWHDPSIVGIYSSRDKAMEKINNMKIPAHYHIEEYEIE